jgi:LacI family transcriptional regulator
MKDVARLAGVSQTTVSYVLNGTGNVDNIPSNTKSRIFAAVEELGYRPNVLAQGLRSNRSHTLGFITDEIATTPFSGNIIKGAQDAAWEHGKVLLVVNTNRQSSLEEAAVDTLLQRQVDAILFATEAHREVVPPANLKDVSTVLIDCFAQDRSLPSVVPDEVAGALTATELLLKKGHRRIALIDGEPGLPPTVGRAEGYIQALAAHGIAVDESLIRFGDWWQEDGYRSARELLRLPDRPTAIFCAADRLAMGAYDAVKELGMHIPDDVAIVGFDNQEVIAAHLRPRLTTMAIPYYEMGKWAVEYLIKHEDEEDTVEPEHAMLHCPLIERESA